MSKKPNKENLVPEDNQVVISNGNNQRVIGPSTVIQVNLKTLMIVLGILLSGLTTAWVNITGRIESSNERTQIELKELSQKIETIKDENIKNLKSELELLKKPVNSVILERQNQLQNQNTNISTSSVENAVPSLPK